MPVRTAAPFPRLPSCMSTRTVLSPSWRSTSRVPSLLPSSITMISRSMPSGSSTVRIRRSTSTTVVRSLYTGTITESLRIFGGVRSGMPTRPLLHVPGVCALQTFAQLHRRFPPEELARPRDVGLSLRRIAEGQRAVHEVGRHAGHFTPDLGELEHRELDRVADVDRFHDLRVEQRDDPAHLVVDEAERTR